MRENRPYGSESAGRVKALPDSYHRNFLLRAHERVLAHAGRVPCEWVGTSVACCVLRRALSDSERETRTRDLRKPDREVAWGV
jgi:hypothetical protein